jgi:hypothetical protein
VTNPAAAPLPSGGASTPTSRSPLGERTRRWAEEGPCTASSRPGRAALLREAVVLRIERVHPELGRHLRLSVRTGTFCRYEPDRAVRWTL